MLKAAKAAEKVDWTDKGSVAEFVFGHTGEIQEKVRKRELDYFKNINKELNKLNSELERSIGLQRQKSLEEKVATEQAGLAQAETNLADDKYVFTQYAHAHEYGDYLNADGSLNVTAVNDALAELDPDASQAEADEAGYLNNLMLQFVS